MEAAVGQTTTSPLYLKTADLMSAFEMKFGRGPNSLGDDAVRRLRHGWPSARTVALMRDSGDVPARLPGGGPVQEWIAVLAALISAVGAFVSVWYSRRTARVERMDAAEELATLFREPLLQAVFSLQSRIYNIIELDFFGRFLEQSNIKEDREYAELNTMYIFARYFCWWEILRRHARFIDPRNDQTNRASVVVFESVHDAFADSISIDEPTFRLFRGEQLALGEVMLVRAADPQPGAPRWECMGYADFVEALEREQVARWFRRLKEDIAVTAHDRQGHDARLRLIQRRLVDVMDVLDPDSHRVPSHLRQRVAESCF
ncbi:MAG TPA: hypothetical protein VK887_05900 [Pseudonocardiaceae bacterium]|nr:hypothetical protein [Pseudonocardiaceae bacterium]